VRQTFAGVKLEPLADESHDVVRTFSLGILINWSMCLHWRVLAAACMTDRARLRLETELVNGLLMAHLILCYRRRSRDGEGTLSPFCLLSRVGSLAPVGDPRAIAPAI